MPKGVYPRRRVGRPAKAAKPAAPAKPANIREEYKTFWDFYNADPEYKSIDELHTESCRSKNSVDGDVRRETYKIQRLLIARDLVLQASNDVDHPESSVEEILKSSTGNDSEMWSGMLFSAADDITGLVTDKCLAIADFVKQRDQKAAERDELLEKLNNRRDVLRKQWEAAEVKQEAK